MPMPYDLSSDSLDIVMRVSLRVSESWAFPGNSPVTSWSITGHGFAAISNSGRAVPLVHITSLYVGRVKFHTKDGRIAANEDPNT